MLNDLHWGGPRVCIWVIYHHSILNKSDDDAEAKWDTKRLPRSRADNDLTEAGEFGPRLPVVRTSVIVTRVPHTQQQQQRQQQLELSFGSVRIRVGHEDQSNHSHYNLPIAFSDNMCTATELGLGFSTNKQTIINRFTDMVEFE